MPIVHIVQFGFKPEVSEAQIDDVVRRMLALKENCIHPTSQKPYIKSATGGKDKSPEGFQGGVTHIFVSEFDNEEDRKYYLEKDPAHQDFIKLVGGLVQTIRVVDFEPGVF